MLRAYVVACLVRKLTVANPATRAPTRDRYLWLSARSGETVAALITGTGPLSASLSIILRAVLLLQQGDELVWWPEFAVPRSNRRSDGQFRSAPSGRGIDPLGVIIEANAAFLARARHSRKAPFVNLAQGIINLCHLIYSKVLLPS
jgi:hypothetical protein